MACPRFRGHLRAFVERWCSVRCRRRRTRRCAAPPRVRSGPRPRNVQEASDVIDRLREQIQARLDQALSEADLLRKALAALDPGSGSAPARKAAGRGARSRRRARSAVSRPNGAATQGARGRRSADSPPASAVKSPAARQRRTAAESAAAAPEAAGQQATGTTERPRRPRPAAAGPAAPVSPSDSAVDAPSGPVTRDTVSASEQSAAPSSRRTPAGQTRGAVLAALAGGEPMTASQVAAQAGVSRGTVATTLSRLAKTGEVQKADRGYRLTPASPPAQPTDTPVAAGAAAQPTGAADAASPAAPPSTAAEANSREAAEATAGARREVSRTRN